MISQQARRLPVACFVALTFSVVPTNAQIPETFTNLQVLPKDIARGDLIGTMRNVAGDLGVRCAHCHVGPDNLEGMDFATDEKPTKKAAREMLKMIRTINGSVLPTLPEREEPRLTVSCFTCHRGEPRPPQHLSIELSVVARAKGGQAAVDHYRQLRQQHFGAGKYDFRVRSLAIVVETLLGRGQVDDALAIARLNLEHYPDAAVAHAWLGAALLEQGDPTGAKASLDRALQLDPQNFVALEALKKLRTRTP